MSKIAKLRACLLATVVLSMLYAPSVIAISIPANTSIGTWDPINRIYTLNTDSTQGIRISESNLTLDGAGHKLTGSVSPSGWAVGVFIDRKTGVTVKNIIVEKFSCGICVYTSNNVTLVGNNLTSNIYYGILLYISSYNNTVINNTVSSNGRFGISIFRNGVNNIVTDNIITLTNGDGIELNHYSTGNILTGNTLSNNSTGVNLTRFADNNTFTNNAIESTSGTGFRIGTSYNTLTSNTISNNRTGITLNQSSNNILAGNILVGNDRGITSSGSLDSHFEHSVDVTNTINGKPIHYIINCPNGAAYDSAIAGALFLIHCNNITVSNPTSDTNKVEVTLWDSHFSKLENLITNGIWLGNSNNNNLIANTSYSKITGIDLYRSSDNTLVGNTANATQQYGIRIRTSSSRNTLIGNTTNANSIAGLTIVSNSHYNTLADNIITLNRDGIRVTQSSHSNILTNNEVQSNTIFGILVGSSDENELTDNTVSNNGSYGVYVSFADNNRVYNNNFISNGIQARVSNGTGNIFNLSKPEGGGNNWSNWSCPDLDGDGFVDQPYVFSGGQDNLPLADSGCILIPAEAIAQIVLTIQDMNLKSGIENALVVKLQNALDAIEAPNADLRNDAINKLEAFIDAVEAQREKALTDEQADFLINVANNIISALN